MAVLSAIILTILLLTYTEGSPVDCGESYQSLLEGLVKLKKTCDTTYKIQRLQPGKSKL